MLVSRLRQRLVIPRVLVRVIGVHAPLLLLLILIVGCGGQSSTESPASEPEPKSEPTTEFGPNKQEVAIKEGSLRDLVQEQVGDFDLRNVDEDAEKAPKLRGYREFVVEGVEAYYVGPSGTLLEHGLVAMRSPEAADNLRQQFETEISSEGGPDSSLEVVDRPIEINGRRVGTVTVMRAIGKEVNPVVLWNNGNLFTLAAIEEGVSGAEAVESDAVESFYESVPY